MDRAGLKEGPQLAIEGLLSADTVALLQCDDVTGAGEGVAGNKQPSLVPPRSLDDAAMWGNADDALLQHSIAVPMAGC